jgi:hypothetical protein
MIYLIGAPLENMFNSICNVEPLKCDGDHFPIFANPVFSPRGCWLPGNCWVRHGIALPKEVSHAE